MKNLHVLFTISLLSVCFCFTSIIGFTADVSPKGLTGETFPDHDQEYARMFGSLSQWIEFPNAAIAQKVGQSITSGWALTPDEASLYGHAFNFHFSMMIDRVNDRIILNGINGDKITFLALSNRHHEVVAYATLLPPFNPVQSLSEVVASSVPAKPLAHIVFPSPAPQFYFFRAEVEITEIQGQKQSNAFIPVDFNGDVGGFVSWFQYSLDLNPYEDLDRRVTIKSRLTIYNESNEIVDAAGITTDVNISETLGGELILLQRKESLIVSHSSVLPQRQDVVRGAQDVHVNAIFFDNSAGEEDKDITYIKLTGYVSGNIEGPLQKDEFGTLTIKDLVNTVRLYEYDVDSGQKIGDIFSYEERGGQLFPYPAAKIFNTEGIIEFKDLHWLIPKGKIRTLVVVAGVSTNSTILDVGDADLARFAVDIADPSIDVFCTLTKNGSVVKVQSDTAAIMPEVYVRESGFLTVEDAPAEVLGRNVLAGETGVLMQTLQCSAQYEDLVATKLRIVKNDPDGAVTSAALTFIGTNGETFTATKTFAGENADFTNIEIPFPKDQLRYVDISVNIRVDAVSGSPFSTQLHSTTGFEVISADGNSTRLLYPSVSTSTVSNTMTVE